MTTKEIAEAVGKDERSVQRWAKKTGDRLSSIGVKLSLVGKSGKPADYDLDETLAIIDHGMGKNAADLFRMSAKQPTAKESLLTEKDIQLITALTAGIVTQVMANLDARVSKIENRVEERQLLLPPPEVAPRDAINRIVRETASKRDMEYSRAWGDLYREFGYRTKSDPKRSAKNRDMAILDYIEAEGLIETLLSVAIEWGKE